MIVLFLLATVVISWTWAAYMTKRCIHLKHLLELAYNGKEEEAFSVHPLFSKPKAKMVRASVLSLHVILLPGQDSGSESKIIDVVSFERVFEAEAAFSKTFQKWKDRLEIVEVESDLPVKPKILKEKK